MTRFFLRVVRMWRRLWFREHESAQSDRDPVSDHADPLVEPHAPTRDPIDVAPVAVVDAPRVPPVCLYIADDSDDLCWHFRRGILDRLDEYFVCIRRVQRHDPNAYRLFGRLGFAITPAHFSDPATPIGPDDRPGFGGVLGITTSGMTRARRRQLQRHPDRSLYPTFLYFEKLKRPSSVELFNGDVYRLTALYDDHATEQLAHYQSTFSVPCRCHVGIDGDGRTRLLREVTMHRHTIRRRTGNRRDVFELTMQSFDVPSWLCVIADVHRDDFPDTPINADTVAGRMLCLAVRSYQATHRRIIIRVKRDQCTAAFGIDVKRARHFFNDRDRTEIAIDGRQKRIFHSVVEHRRVLADARTTTVRAHYRGIRRFEWNGYHIEIVFPKNNYVVECPIAGTLDEDTTPPPAGDRWVGPGEFGRRLDRILSQ